MNSRIFFIALMMLVVASSISYSQNKMEAGGAIKFDINTGSSNGEYDFTGINGRFYYYLNDNFRLAPNININFPYKETDSGIEAKAYVTTYNAQVHYLFDFLNHPGLKTYALGGLSYNHVKVEASGMGQSVTETANDMSLSLGVGMDYQVKFGKLFFEVQDMFGDYDPFVLSFGVMIALN
ncbi:outer membrane beta-barrel protein [uncultured Draconibacterium sp.]|uniref:outer membrane beta-barrel protein n=1 Tax=uncultured Draconibacterium sp. TaxID=1573823 RepID=UPI0029C8C331|nr:outer membrane beta-barrel protein [uncultured Draconibacterium sp.]